MAIDYLAMRLQLIRHEGLRLKPYTDTVGKITIGVGRNLTDVGLTRDEVMELLNNDLQLVVADCMTFRWFPLLDEVRQRAIVDLRFNLGPGKFRAFKRALAAMAEQNYPAAAVAFRASRWYRQVGRRGVEIVHMIETGTDL